MSELTLRAHPVFSGVEGPVLVVVMDGVGLGRRDAGDAVHLARTPTLDWLAGNTPTCALAAHGRAVGMPSDGDMGNSEVGHNALGAGRVFDQGAKLVEHAIAERTLFDGAVWKEQVARVRERDSTLHFIGLLSDGNVHSHIDHLLAMIDEAGACGVARVRVHGLLDGRDVPRTSALEYVSRLEGELEKHRDAGRDFRVASGGGRMTTTMDRYEAEWAMVERGWALHVRGNGRRFRSLEEAVLALRDEAPGISDQELPGFVIADDEGPVGPIRDGDAVIFFNFRGDRALELTRAFEEDAFDGFDRGERPDVAYAGMMQYDGDLGLPSRFLVEPPRIDRSLGEHLAAAGVSQLAISETQKYGHVTYFWNGNRTAPFESSLERYIEVGSDTRPFDERPWMKAAEITDRLLDELKTGAHRHARVNFANGDMVGHTGTLGATVLAVEAVDLQLARLCRFIERSKGAMVVTADHGNADQMFEIDKKSGEFARGSDGELRARTSHSLNAVPCHVLAPELAARGLRINGRLEAPGLANVAATTLALLGFDAPEGYGPSLIAFE